MDSKFLNKKLEEGNRLMETGNKYLETSVWKMKRADHDSAAAEFEKAATCYKLGKDFDKAINASLKAADSFLKVC